MEPAAILLAVVASLVYAVIFYAKNHFKPEQPESFDPFKFGAVIVVGVCVGIGFALSGLPITKESVWLQLGEYGSVVALVETILKIIVRGIKKARAAK